MKFKTYFTARHILKRKGLFNLVLSDRSDGKSVDCYVRILEDYMLFKHIGIYCRRFKDDLTPTIINNFFNKVFTIETNDPAIITIREYYKGAIFTGNRTGVKVKFPNGESDYIVFFIVLSIGSRLKSTLDQFTERIFVINFDEYIPLDNRYLPSEMLLLLELYSSIDRDRNVVQLLCLGNRITPFCPFLDFFDVGLKITGNKIRGYRDNTLQIQIYTSNEHRKTREVSRFNTLIKDTGYDDYYLGGILKALELKQASTLGLDYFCSFITDRGEGSIYTNGNAFVISTKQRRDGYLITDKLRKTTRECYTVNFAGFRALFRSLYQSNNLAFENERSYYIFEPILLKLA